MTRPDESPDSLRLDQSQSGVLLPVQAHPKAARNGITGIHDGRLKVSITEAPEKGKANAALIKLLARSLGLRRSQVSLMSGATSARKTFCVSGVEPAELRRRIGECFDP